MTEITNCCKNKIKMGAQQSYKNLTMFPVLISYSISGNNLTMIEPLSKYKIELIEIGENKETPKFKVINKSNKPVNDIVAVSEKYTEQNRSNFDTIRYHGNDRITASWDYIEQFARVDGQIGAIFLINGKLAGMVYFRSPEAFKKSFIKIVECYARKADGEYEPTMDLISSESDVKNDLNTPIDSRTEIQSVAGI